MYVKKTLSAFFITLIFFVLPLLLVNSSLLLTMDFAILYCALFILFFTQPPLVIMEVKEKSKNDRYSILFILIMFAVGLIATIIDWGYIKKGQTGSYIAKSIGVLFILLGLFLRIISIQLLGKQFTATVQIVQKHTLIIKGPYKIVRHPSYLGAFLVILGIPIFLESFFGIVTSFISMLIAYYCRIRVEEKTLVNYFGNQYKQYQQRSKKMFPYIW